MRHFILLIALFVAAQLFAQNKKYTTSNAHSHNDYEQARPFQMAYDQGFGSIEADVFLVNNNLLVAHESKNTNPAKTLRHLYLNPIKEKIMRIRDISTLIKIKNSYYLLIAKQKELRQLKN